MTANAVAPAPPPDVDASARQYQPGVCNIGPDEVARRQRGGRLALVATVGLLGALMAIHAPVPARLLVAIPAADAASGYFQARLRFCAGFGARGVSNFGRLGEVEHVVDDEARDRDRARSLHIGVASLAVGVAVAVAAAALPR